MKIFLVPILTLATSSLVISTFARAEDAPPSAAPAPAPAASPAPETNSVIEFTPRAKTPAKAAAAPEKGGGSGPEMRTSVESAKAAFLGLIDGLGPMTQEGLTRDFQVHGCTKWRNQELIAFFLFGQPMTRTFAFKENCDLGGPLTVTEAPFPVTLKLRHLQSFDQVKMTCELKKELNLGEQRADVSVSCEGGILFTAGREEVKFTGDYAFTFKSGSHDPADNKGGHLKVTEVRGKKTDITEDIRVK